MKGLEQIIAENAQKSGITIQENLKLAKQGQFIKPGKKQKDSIHPEVFEILIGANMSICSNKLVVV